MTRIEIFTSLRNYAEFLQNNLKHLKYKELKKFGNDMALFYDLISVCNDRIKKANEENNE